MGQVCVPRVKGEEFCWGFPANVSGVEGRERLMSNGAMCKGVKSECGFARDEKRKYGLRTEPENTERKWWMGLVESGNRKIGEPREGGGNANGYIGLGWRGGNGPRTRGSRARGQEGERGKEMCVKLCSLRTGWTGGLVDSSTRGLMDWSGGRRTPTTHAAHARRLLRERQSP